MRFCVRVSNNQEFEVNPNKTDRENTIWTVLPSNASCDFVIGQTRQNYAENAKFKRSSKKKRVTAGEVDKLGKEQGTTNEWTTNDDTNTQALSTLSLLQVKEER